MAIHKTGCLQARRSCRFLLGVLCALALSGMNMLHSASAVGVQPTPHPAEFYEHHIIAVDAEGSALIPNVTVDKRGVYHSHTTAMEGENTDSPAKMLEKRCCYFKYLDAMLGDIRASRPSRIVIYIHGGMNDVNGAVEKAAALADRLSGSGTPGGIYFIGICWNSDLLPGVSEHLFRVRQGLFQPDLAVATAPITLLADAGSAVCRTPVNIVNWGLNDFWTVHPHGFTREVMSRERIAQFEARMKYGNKSSVLVSSSCDDRHQPGPAFDVARWFLTLPLKIVDTSVVDGLGTQPWKDMLRHTETMFTRETRFLEPLGKGKIKEANDAAQALKDNDEAAWNRLDPIIEQYIDISRPGAVGLFCQRVLQNVPRSAHTTLVGHSMGAIVCCNIMDRYPKIRLDNVVFLAAACSVNNFKEKALPYLRANRNTRLYNLCLNPQAERSEKNPGEWDLSPRGSLLVWIDNIYQDPSSENERTFGRMENAVLSSDCIDQGIQPRIVMKSFGRDRPGTKDPWRYTDPERNKTRPTIAEPVKHAEMSRWEPADINNRGSPNFMFWEDVYWKVEQKEACVPRDGGRF